ncbi:MAG: hypothetical protein COA43_05775 [Robiginitomaculum sp.]|nr:MAG: hypothetical protein COA43_05775 [Robiginitomaculum sp.]
MSSVPFISVWFSLFVCILTLSSCEKSTPIAIDISEVFDFYNLKTNEGALLIVRLEDGKSWSVGGERLLKRFSPASTSKILHTYIALESGVVTDETQEFIWDGRARFLDSWNQNQTLKTAFHRSAVWVYQDIVSQIGYADMQNYVNTFEYGNMNIGSVDNLTTYWLNGELQISALEQVAFLSKLVKNEFNISKRSYDRAEVIMQKDIAPHQKMIAKTGWYSGGNTDIGWYIGWFKNDEEQIYVFAFNMDMHDIDDDLRKRRDVVISALTHIRATEIEKTHFQP